jgi:hypothetical protein
VEPTNAKALNSGIESPLVVSGTVPKQQWTTLDRNDFNQHTAWSEHASKYKTSHRKINHYIEIIDNKLTCNFFYFPQLRNLSKLHWAIEVERQVETQFWPGKLKFVIKVPGHVHYVRQVVH